MELMDQIVLYPPLPGRPEFVSESMSMMTAPTMRPSGRLHAAAPPAAPQRPPPMESTLGKHGPKPKLCIQEVVRHVPKVLQTVVQVVDKHPPKIQVPHVRVQEDMPSSS